MDQFPSATSAARGEEAVEATGAVHQRERQVGCGAEGVGSESPELLGQGVMMCDGLLRVRVCFFFFFRRPLFFRINPGGE